MVQLVQKNKPIVADAEGKSPYEQAKEILSQSNKKEDLISDTNKLRTEDTI